MYFVLTIPVSFLIVSLTSCLCLSVCYEMTPSAISYAQMI